MALLRDEAEERTARIDALLSRLQAETTEFHEEQRVNALHQRAQAAAVRSRAQAMRNEAVRARKRRAGLVRNWPSSQT